MLPSFSVFSRSISFSIDFILFSMVVIFPSSSRILMFGESTSSAGIAHTLSITSVTRINIIAL